MREARRAAREILTYLRGAFKKVDDEQIDGFIKLLSEAKRVFVFGAGRSGLIAKAFAMRLMHLGIDVYAVGETITPALREGDVFVAISGSGETDLTVEAARGAKTIGTKIAAITSYPDSSLAKLADHMVIVPGRVKTASTSKYLKRELWGEHASLAPLGTLFEITSLVLLDSVIASLMIKLGKREEDLRARHATI